MLVNAKIFLFIGELVASEYLQLFELVLGVQFMEEVQVSFMLLYLFGLFFYFFLKNVRLLKDLSIDQLVNNSFLYILLQLKILNLLLKLLLLF